MFRHDNQQDDQSYQDHQGQPGQLGQYDGLTHPTQAAPPQLTDNGGDPVGQPAAAVAGVPQDDHADQGDQSDLGGYVATPAPGAPGHQPVNTDDLLDIKHEALQQLSPLVGHLEQTPEEKFRTTMMMIQASDNHALVREAYESAKQIGNDKERAQALLDIINEINYFTQQGQAPAVDVQVEQQ